jgi:hypothetical protein
MHQRHASLFAALEVIPHWVGGAMAAVTVDIAGIYRGVSRRRSLLLKITCLMGLFMGSVNAETCGDIALKISVTTADTSPYITLNVWTDSLTPAIASQAVYRRVKGTVAWGSAIGTIPVPTTIGRQTFADSTALSGVEYEYWIKRMYTSGSVVYVNNPATGYIMAASKLPMVESRGTMLVVVETSALTALAKELDVLRKDLAADGWLTQVLTVSSSDTVISVKNQIKSAYTANPTSVKAVLLLGHVPVPYSGDSTTYVDGHAYGTAHEADGYYGEMDGVWTDTTVNCAAPTGYWPNVPGDGLFDQAVFPSPVELMVGRVDMANLTLAPDTSCTANDLLRRYLNKLHAYKHRRGPYASIVSQAVIMNMWFNMDSGKLIDLGTYAWANTCADLGWVAPDTARDQPTISDGRTFLIGSHGGLGGVYALMNSYSLGSVPYRVVFMTQYASGMSYFDSANQPIRAALAGNVDGDSQGVSSSLTVASMVHGRNHWFMHSMSTGNPIGYAVRMSMNNQMSTVSNPVYNPHSTDAYNTPGGPGNNGTTINFALFGDPSLRIAMPRPPTNVSARVNGGQIILTWSASPESNLIGYHVYRASSSYGPYARLTSTPIASLSYVDTTALAGANYTYLVRALVLQASKGGTYENLSVGELVEVENVSVLTGFPASPGSLTVARIGASAALSWVDNANSELGYRVERASGYTGTYSVLTSLGANATSWIDISPPESVVSYYRVVAFNSVGDSTPIGPVSYENRRGSISFSPNETSKKTLYKTTDIAPVASPDNGPRCINFVLPRSSPLVPVIRAGGSAGAASVQYSTNSGSDITVSGTLTWANGESGIKYISIPVSGLASPSHPQQVHIDLSNASGAGLSAVLTMASCLIVDQTSPPLSGWSEVDASMRSVMPNLIDDGNGVSLSSSMTGGASYWATGWGTSTGYESNGHFIYKNANGNAVLQTYLPKATPAQAGAFYGIAVRGSTAENALCVATIISPTGATMMSRTSAGASSAYTAANPSFSPPCWVRLSRSGSIFTSSVSLDGSNWTSLGTASITDAVNMPSSACWGFVHASDKKPGDYHVARFDKISLTPITASVVATTASACEFPGYPGRFTISLSERRNVPTVVNYTISGTATPGNDYTTLSGSITIAAGQTSSSIDVLPLSDAISETGGETVTLMIGSSADAIPGSSASATITIYELAISPMNGPTSGGTTLTIRGSNLVGTGTVSVGNVAATNVTVVNSTTVTCLTPAHQPGLSAVWVQTGVAGWMPAGNFTYDLADSRWPLDTVAGLTSEDVTGKNSAMLINAPALTTGKLGQAVHLNGSDQYLSTAYSIAMPANQPFTLSVWLRTSVAGGKIMGFGNAQTGASASWLNGRNLFIEPTGALKFGVVPGTTIESARAITDGNWHHLAATLSTTDGIKLYIDGTKVAENMAVVSAQAISGFWRIGYDDLSGWTTGTNAFVNGDIDDPRIYYRALSEIEIAALANLAPTLTSNTPNTGNTNGGTVITLTGTNLTNASSVSFGGIPSSSVTVINETTVTCVAPAHAAGMVDVVITTPGGTATLASAYTYAATVPTLSMVSPATGPVAGGTTMTLTGSNLTGLTGVTIGGASASSISVLSATSATCITPPHVSGMVDVVINTTGGSAALPGAFTYLNAPAMGAITPVHGPTAGGTTVTITGTNLTGTTSVTFGGTAATSVTVVSATTVTCTAPAHAAGVVDVVLTAPGGTVSAVGAYTYTVAPTIASLSPTSGPIAGGTTVTITGTNLTGTTSVTFGGTAATSVTVVSATTVTCTVPSHAAGVVDVVLTAPGGTVSAVGAYTYTVAPTIASLSPTSGPIAGGTTVTITGANLTGTTGVTFGGTAATSVTAVSATTVTCTVPARAAGLVDVAITAPGVTVSAAGAYTYMDAPTITGLSPTSGPITGSTTVTITGTNLAGTTSVTFGGTAATSVTAVSATTVTCIIPAHAAGAVDVAVTAPGGTISVAGAYTYMDAPTITGLSPTSGPIAGGTTVSITGTNFTGTTSITFGGTAATSMMVVSATEVSCIVPPLTGGVVDVALVTPGGIAVIADAFTYMPAPTLTDLSPLRGPLAGGTLVTLRGTNLSGTTAVTFDGWPATSMSVISATIVTCVTPSHGSGMVDVVISTPGGQALLAGAFKYLPAPKLTGITPSTGLTTGGAVVTLTGTDLIDADVTIGGVPAVVMTGGDGTSLTFTLPAHAAGTVDVVVSTVGGTDTLAGGITYQVAASDGGGTIVAPAGGSGGGGCGLGSLGGMIIAFASAMFMKRRRDH